MVLAMNTVSSSWSTAISATLHCLTGCAIGEVLGMVLSTWWGWSTVPSIALAVALAFFFGYLLTFSSVRRHGVSTREGVRLALASDTVSITTMEVVDNLFILARPGRDGRRSRDAACSGGAWPSRSLVAFVLTVPVNRWLIARGRGHAVVHEMHGH